MEQKYTYTYDVFGNISGVFPVEHNDEEAKTEKAEKQSKKAAK